MESSSDRRGPGDRTGRKVAIVAARFNDFIVSSLLKGATASWHEHGGAAEDLLVARVPGAFELPVVARKLAASGRWDAVIALGCVIRGDTPHFEYVAGECARGPESRGARNRRAGDFWRSHRRNGRAGARAGRDDRRQ